MFKKLSAPAFFVLLASAVCPSKLLAWSERGHDLVTRVAVQNLRLLSNDDINILRPFTLRDHTLSHLSNVPDIVWRAPYMSEAERRSNGPTHYIGIEKVYDKRTSVTDMDARFEDYAKRVEKAGFKSVEEVGTAPWRVTEFYDLMVSSLQKAKREKSQQAKIDATDEALLYAGLMSHFVGDLANPHHTTENYDGQLTGNNGLHAYFESDVVRELTLDLSARVYLGSHSAMATLLEQYTPELRNKILHDPQLLINALVLDSNRNLSTLMALDENVSLIERSTEDRVPAVRKSPSSVSENYQAFAVQRLALGAAVLSRLWYQAWQDAGSPDLSKYNSYHYPVKPDFIPPSYQK